MHCEKTFIEFLPSTSEIRAKLPAHIFSHVNIYEFDIYHVYVLQGAHICVSSVLYAALGEYMPCVSHIYVFSFHTLMLFYHAHICLLVTIYAQFRGAPYVQKFARICSPSTHIRAIGSRICCIRSIYAPQTYVGLTDLKPPY